MVILTIIAIFASLGNENITGKITETYHQARINLVSRYLPPEIILQSNRAKQYGSMNINIIDHGSWAQLITITDINDINDDVLVGIGGKVFILRKQGDDFLLQKTDLNHLIEQSKTQDSPNIENRNKESIINRIF